MLLTCDGTPGQEGPNLFVFFGPTRAGLVDARARVGRAGVKMERPQRSEDGRILTPVRTGACCATSSRWKWLKLLAAAGPSTTRALTRMFIYSLS